MEGYGAISRAENGQAPLPPATSNGRRFSLPGSSEIMVKGERAHVPLENKERRKSLAEKMLQPEHDTMWPKTFRTSVDAMATRHSLSHAAGDLEKKGLLVVPMEDEFERPVGTASFNQTTFNGINTMLGCGILSLPYAFRCSGWLLGTFILVTLLVVTNYTAKQLRKCIDFYPGIRSFPDIGEVAFGARGRYIISVLFYFEIFTASVMYMILAADNLLILFPTWTQWQFIALVTIIVLPQASTSQLDLLSYFSLVGIASSVFLCAVVLYFGGSTHEQPGSYLNPVPTHLLPPDYLTSTISFGLVMVGFAGHACMPSIYESMENPKMYDRMVDATWLILGVVYMGMAAVGYLMYGDETQDQITKNITGRGMAATISVWLIVVNPITKYGINTNPISLAFEEISPKLVPERILPVFNLVARWLLTIAVAAVAMGVPNFARVTGFIGSAFSFSVSIIFPVVAYVKMYGEEIPPLEKILNYIILVVSTVMMVLGTAGSIIFDVPM